MKSLMFDEKRALKYSQAVLGNTLSDFDFRDRHGRAVRLSEFRGKPLVISLIFSNCPRTCSLITNSLSDARTVAEEALDKDSFNIVTIGFDVANDTPERMGAYADAHDAGNFSNWKFLSADAATIHALTKELGFIYFPSPNGFDHLAQTTVISKEGKVFRQVYGETFELPILIDGLRNMIFGTDAPFSSIDDLVKGVRLFCTIYDPTTNTYRFDYSIFAKMAGGGIVIIGMIIFIVRNSILIRRRRKDAEKTLVQNHSS